MIFVFNHLKKKRTCVGGVNGMKTWCREPDSENFYNSHEGIGEVTDGGVHLRVQ
jgi:hypothetical protein